MKICALLASCILLTTQLIFAMEKRNNKDDSTDAGKVLHAVCYGSVQNFLDKKLNKESRDLIIGQISDIEYNWPKPSVDVKFLTGTEGMFELRTNLPDSRSMRSAMLPIPKNKELVVVHAFFKRADKQQNDINFAKERAREYRNQQKEDAKKDDDTRKDSKKSGRIFKKIGTRK